MTLFLPENLPKSQPVRNYVFGHNETHMALALDYGSLINHHESANARAGNIIGFNELDFQVGMGFQCANHHVLKNAACMHAHIHNGYTCT